MAELKLTIPSTGEKNTVAEPKVDTALTTIRTWANGEVGAVNMESGFLVGAWTSLTSLGAKVEEGGLQSVRVRLENAGATARLRGEVKVKSGQKLEIGEALFTMPASFRPPSGAADLIAYTASGGAKPLFISIPHANEASNCSVAIAEGNAILLDGLTWNVT